MNARFDEQDHTSIPPIRAANERVVTDLATHASQYAVRINKPRRRYWQAALWILGTAAVLLAWPQASPRHPLVSETAWDLELTADGDQPVSALVYGEGSGIHLITVPGAGANAEERNHLPVRPAKGDVHLISLGWNGLRMRTTAPAGGPLVSASANARTVTLFASAKGTGVRTGW